MAYSTSPYIPSFIQAALSGTRPIQLTFSDVSDTNIASTSSFMYDPSDVPLKSTQQLNVDWSKFENHTFFMSAEAKTNLAFDQIINGFPFDGTRQQTEIFFEKLTGFDKWVFDQFPKFRGQLHFSGTKTGEDTDGTKGTFINVTDAVGALFPELSTAATGVPVLNPTGKSLSIEMMLYVPAQANDTQVVCQKMSGSSNGFSLYLVPTGSLSTVEARFSVLSGSTNLTANGFLRKGAFNHVCAVLNRDYGVDQAQFYLNSSLVSRSQLMADIGYLPIDGSPFIVGSGSAMNLRSGVVTPTQTLSGVMDELRIFHSARSVDQQMQYAPKSLFATPDLKLYYRFNEPPGLIGSSVADPINRIIIDSSGNALHAIASNVSSSYRLDASNDPTSMMIYERPETTPVLFPAFPGIVSLNTQLLSSASFYDAENPNVITKLVPQHYLLEGAANEGFDTPEGAANNPYAGTGIPGQGKMGNTQLLLSMLYIWARFFDEMKLFVSSFSTLRTVDYDTNDTIPDSFILNLVKQYGFQLPPLFTDSTLEQYVRAENIGPDITTGDTPLRSVQHQLLRRVLINLPSVIRSKGTQNSIKSFLRSVGIDPDNSVRLREYGGPTTRSLTYSRETKRMPGVMVDFVTSSLVASPFLSASRTEPGWPLPAGTFVNGVSNNKNDGLLTSGSWTWESIVRFTPASLYTNVATTQSLGRVCVSGSMPGGVGLVANLVAMSSSIDPKLVLYVRPGDSSTSPILSMSLSMPQPGIFNSDRWNVSFGVDRNDSVGSTVSSSYFLRLATQNDGELTSFFATSSYFYETPRSDKNVFRTTTATTNYSGSFLALGTNQNVASGTGGSYLFLNDTGVIDDSARVTKFNGRASNVRFWSRAVSQDEFKEHVRNYRSLGVKDPYTSYNYNRTSSGSFGRLRIDSLGKQDSRIGNATASLGPIGGLTFLDFTQNGFHLTGTGFPINTDSVTGEVFDLSYISPSFDEASTNQKVRVRSYQDASLVEATPWAQTAPAYDIVRSETPTDDARFEVEFSLVDALNRDVVNLFATLDYVDNALGDPTLQFSPDYPALVNLQDVYFHRLQQKLNFRAFFEFYRWFDTSIGTFIQQLVPKKTNFKGTNFVIESHMLERHKVEYRSSEMYVQEANKQNIDSVILLQQVEGSLGKY